MRTIDFTPLYRSAVGFDRLAGLLESAARNGPENGWPLASSLFRSSGPADRPAPAH